MLSILDNNSSGNSVGSLLSFHFVEASFLSPILTGVKAS